MRSEGAVAHGTPGELHLRTRCRMLMSDEELGDLVRLWHPFGSDRVSTIGLDEQRRLGDQLSVREELIVEAASIRETAEMTDDDFAAWLAKADKIIPLAWFAGVPASIEWLEAGEADLDATLSELEGPAAVRPRAALLPEAASGISPARPSPSGRSS